jgi:hypothetical protein
MFEPALGPFVCINSMTRVIIQPKIDSLVDSIQTSNIGLNYEDWTGCFQVDFFESNNDDSSNLCRNLTTIEIGKSKNCEKALNKSLKYLVSIQAVRTPMQTLRVKDSSTSSMKKFLQSIENSYTEDFYEIGTLNSVTYGYLTIDEEDLDSQLRNGCQLDSNLRVKMSQFLRNQLKLFEISPKVIIKASSVRNKENEALFSNTTRKTIKLKTNYQKNVIYFLFRILPKLKSLRFKNQKRLKT